MSKEILVDVEHVKVSTLYLKYSKIYVKNGYEK